jgi:hypothetical protein
MILALNGVDPSYFGDFGAASASVAGLQTALKNFGKNIGDKTLMVLVVDGLIGPKTVAAANRALRTHIGAGQAPAELRTGVLTKAEVVANAERIKQLVNTEARRRGFGIYVGPDVAPKKVVAKKVVKKAAPQATTAMVPYAPSAAVAPRSAAVAAQSPAGRTTYTPAGPVYTPPEELGPVYTPPVTRTMAPAQTSIMVPSTKTYVVPPGASGGGMDVEAVVKWAAIGLGVVALLGGAYYYVTRRQPAMAGFGAAEGQSKPFRLTWLVPNNAYVVTWGEQVIPIHDQRFFATKAEAKAALHAAGLKLVGNKVVTA